MILGFDGSYAILKNNTTEGNYSRIVVEAMAGCYPRHHIYVYTPAIGHSSTAMVLAAARNVNIKQPRKTLSKSLWLNWSGIVNEINRHHVNVYHGLAGRLPLRMAASRARSVVTVHGVAHKVYPRDFALCERIKRSLLTRKACRLADCVVATSWHTKDDLVKYMGIDADKIRVVYPAVDQRFLGRAIEAELEAVRDKYKLPTRYILVVSTLLKHKNVLAVLRALKCLQDKDIQLVLVGSETKYYNEVLRPYAESNHLMHRLLHITRAHAGDMASIYRMADVLVAPSRYEGFGLTVIEAQACGIPVITTSGTAMEEAAGDAALLFEPDDLDTLQSHLEHILSDQSLRQQIIAAGERNIKRFTRKRLAEDLDNLYHEVMRK